MADDVKLAVAGKAPVLFWGRPGGGIPTVDEIFEQIRQLSIPHESVLRRSNSNENRICTNADV
jgi:hypothetical protein